VKTGCGFGFHPPTYPVHTPPFSYCAKAAELRDTRARVSARMVETL
jgi:hypothetical protein